MRLTTQKLKIFLLVMTALIGFCFTSKRTAQATVLPSLPQVTVDSTYPTLSASRTIRLVKSSCSGISNCTTSLQSAIDAAILGDEIVVDANMTINGAVILRNKLSGSGWIVIRTANLSALPAAGVRVSPSYASQMPKIVAPGFNEVALKTEDKAHNYRIVGFEIKKISSIVATFDLVQLGYGAAPQTSITQLPYNLVIDRSYIHGDSTANIRRGISLNAGATAIVDSYISAIHEEGADSQAIGGWNGTGPYKITNNFLEAGGECILFGGADPAITDAQVIASDIEVRQNYFYNPLSWRIGDPSYDGSHWIIKNLFELKNARRVLLEGNVFENMWEGQGQAGFPIVFTPRTFVAPWTTVADVTFRKNIVKHAYGGVFNILGSNDNSDGGGQSQRAQRILVENNLFLDTTGVMFQLVNSIPAGTIPGGILDLTVNHNTGFVTGTNSKFSSVGDNNNSADNHENIVFTNNLLDHGEYGFYGSGVGEGFPAFNTFIKPGGYTFSKNAIFNFPWWVSPSSYPSSNFYPSTVGEVGFTNVSSGNYALSSTSPYRSAGTDGKDLGADVAAVNSLTSCAIGGNCGSTPTGSSLVGDINKDGIVNAIDWSIMNAKWLTSDATADLNNDGIVNSLDWSILNANWFKRA